MIVQEWRHVPVELLYILQEKRVLEPLKLFLPKSALPEMLIRTFRDWRKRRQIQRSVFYCNARPSCEILSAFTDVVGDIIPGYDLICTLNGKSNVFVMISKDSFVHFEERQNEVGHNGEVIGIDLVVRPKIISMTIVQKLVHGKRFRKTWHNGKWAAWRARIIATTPHDIRVSMLTEYGKTVPGVCYLYEFLWN